MSKVGMSKLMSSFVDKYRNWQKIVRQNNGIVGTFLMLFRLVRLCVGYGCRVGLPDIQKRSYFCPSLSARPRSGDEFSRNLSTRNWYLNNEHICISYVTRTFVLCMLQLHCHTDSNTFYPRESEGLWNHRRWFVCLSVCYHDN